jgi:RNA-directed DNA polymerase
MGVEQQKGTEDQLSLFTGGAAFVRSFVCGDAGSGTAAGGERQANTASEGNRALATDALMEKVCERENLNRAYKKVKSNRGAPGVDGMSVDELGPWLKAHGEELIRGLLEGSHQPRAVRGIEIPKPGGGVRQLGIPTVVDRLVQQAILQVLSPLVDPTFSGSSYGFRPGRSAHQALRKAQEYVAEGRKIVVDVDLEKFFDRVDHDVLMSRLARRVRDKRLLRIVRCFLEAGMLKQGAFVKRDEGTPQGGPLSPLLGNLLLDELDQELERRGHRFCRYADDCNIYVATHAAGERVMVSVTRFLEERLRLRVNTTKSAVAHVSERKFLGHRLLAGGKLGIAPQSLERAKDRVRAITRRSRGVSIERMVSELNSFLTGWVAYFRYASAKAHLRQMDEWVRRKLRCARLRQRKRGRSMTDLLVSLGVPRKRARSLGGSGRGWWRIAGSPQANEGMCRQWFQALGLVSLTARYMELQN